MFELDETVDEVAKQQAEKKAAKKVGNLEKTLDLLKESMRMKAEGDISPKAQRSLNERLVKLMRESGAKDLADEAEEKLEYAVSHDEALEDGEKVPLKKSVPREKEVIQEVAEWTRKDESGFLISGVHGAEHGDVNLGFNSPELKSTHSVLLSFSEAKALVDALNAAIDDTDSCVQVRV